MALLRIPISIAMLIGFYFLIASAYGFYQFLQLRGGPKTYSAEELEQSDPETKNIIVTDFLIVPGSAYKSMVTINHGSEQLDYYAYGIISKRRDSLGETEPKIFLRSKMAPKAILQVLVKDSFNGYYEKDGNTKSIDNTALENQDLEGVVEQFIIAILLLCGPIFIYHVLRSAAS